MGVAGGLKAFRKLYGSYPRGVVYYKNVGQFDWSF